MLNKLFKTCCLTFLLFSPFASAADATCPDAGLLSGKIMSDICFECMFPIKIAGVSVMTGPNPPPSQASDSAFCTCRDDAGLPQPGYMLSYWNPVHAIEIVNSPGCSPILTGARIPIADVGRSPNMANADPVAGDDATTSTEYHYFSFPVVNMLEMMAGMGNTCDRGTLPAFDPMYFSELDPTHASDELAFFVYPEAALYARPDAIISCGADSIAATVTGEALETLNWCAWGNLYNLSGSHGKHEPWPILTNKTAVRATAVTHRRGLAYHTMGDLSSCGGIPYPTLPKTLYKYSYFYPVPEANSVHAISESEFLWGAGRMVPGPGENAVIIQWKWYDCCRVL